MTAQRILFLLITVSSLAALLVLWTHRLRDNIRLEAQQIQLSEMRREEPAPKETEPEEAEGWDAVSTEDLPAPEEPVYEVLPEYRAMLEENPDLVGWLRIEGTEIDYPVMQTPWDEDYYLDRGFDRLPNRNGSLILGADCRAGTGTREQGYAEGAAPSANLLIHGHTMRSGAMFGNLPLYEDPDYAAEHSVILFDSLYEHRAYEVISVFYSQVFYEDEEVFKYYRFAEASSPEDFAVWYDNIRALSLYDTGVTAAYGDEFITLSCCSYHTEDGRFVVVGRRVSAD